MISKFLIILMCLGFCSLASATTIHLKDGKTHEGTVVERTDKYIKMDIGVGIPITFYLDEILEIIEAETEKPAAVSKGPVPGPVPKKVYPKLTFEDPQIAIGWWKSAVKDRPNDFNAHNELGKVYASLGRYREALPYFKKAVELNSQDVELYINLIDAYRELEEFQKVEENSLKLKALFQRKGDQQGVAAIDEFLKELP